MDMTPQKPKGRELGRGLSALLGTAGEESGAPQSNHQPQTAPIESC